MDISSSFIRNVKAGTTPFYRVVGSLLRMLVRPRAPRLPRTGLIVVPLRALYELHFGLCALKRSVIGICYRSPLFQARCASVGRNLSLDGMPFVSGHTEIRIGDNVWIGGNVSIFSGAILKAPKLTLGNFAEVGWGVTITVNREVIIEDHARVAFDCRISDSDAHPVESDLRAQNKPPREEDIKAVRICRYAWIGNGCHIMKGVTIGEGAIIGASSVVIADVPAFCLAAGNPARVFLKNFGQPSIPTESVTSAP